MALQFSSALRNAWLNLLQTAQATAFPGNSAILKVFTGAAPVNCAAADSGTKLVEWDLAASWLGAASGGGATANSLPIAAVAATTGTAGYFRLYASDGTTCHMQGSVTTTGGGGDATIDNSAIVTGQAVNLSGLTLTAPGA
jgi:hypothetical protein